MDLNAFPLPATDPTNLSDTLAWWREQHTHRLLTHAEELALAEQVQAGHAAGANADAAAQGATARNLLVKYNVRLVIKEARRHIGRGVDLADLIQSGIVGLISAAEKYQPERQVRFSTYATWWIRQAITRSIDNEGRPVRLPCHLLDRIARLRRIEQAAHAIGERLDDAQFAARAGITIEQLARARAATELLTVYSLEYHQDDEDLRRSDTPRDLHTQIADPGVDIEREVAAGDTRQRLAEALSRLSPAQRRVLQLRFGLDGSGAYRTLGEVGQCLGVSRERVRQIEAAALEHLRDPALGLRDLLEAA